MLGEMRFSTGIFDSLFGEKITIELPGSDGQIIKRSVSRKWFEQMQHEGKARQVTEPMIRVHVLSPGGCKVEHRVVGRDVDAQTCEKFRDPTTGDVYALTVFEHGQPKTYFLAKHLWDEAKAKMDAV
jgi:hypothetical protein